MHMGCGIYMYSDGNYGAVPGNSGTQGKPYTASTSEQAPQGAPQPEPYTYTPYKPKKDYSGAIKLIVLAAVTISVLIGIYALITHSHISTPTTTVVTTYVNLSGIRSCTALTKPGTYYVEQSITPSAGSRTCIYINGNNIKLIGNGNKIIGNGPFVATEPPSYGILVSNSTGVSIEGLNVSKFSYGIYLLNSSSSALSSDQARNNTLSGIYLDNSYNNTLRLVFASGTGSKYGGISIYGGGNNTVVNATSQDNAYTGVILDSSSNIFDGGSFTGNPVDVQCYGNSTFTYSNKFNNVDCSINNYCSFANCASINKPYNLSLINLPHAINTCGGIYSPGNYILSSPLNTSRFVSNPNGQNPIPCITISADSVTLNCNNQTISGAGYGILVNKVYNITLNDCRIAESGTGIYSLNSFSVNITRANITSSGTGIALYDSVKGSIYDSNYSYNKYGLYINGSSGFIIQNNRGSNNAYGIYVAKAQSDSFSGGAFSKNTKSDVYCTAGMYNSTQNLFQGAECGVTDCNWALSCSTKTFPPISLYPLTSCSDIVNSGNYSISSNIIGTGDCFDVEASNVNISCNGNTVGGAGSGNAFFVSGRQNVTISDCKISGFSYGLRALNSSYIIFRNSNVIDSGGVSFSNVSSSTVANVIADGYASSGFSAYMVSNSVMILDNATHGVGNSSGFLILNSTNNLIANDTSNFNPSAGFSFKGSAMDTVQNNTAFNNGVDYSCAGSSNGIYAERGGINRGSTKDGCLWLAAINPITEQSCIVISSSLNFELTSDMVYTYGHTCINVYNAPGSTAIGSTINCNNHTVIASKGGTFVNVANASKVTVENCYLKGFTNPITGNGGNMSVENNLLAGGNASIILINGNYPYIYNNTVENSSTGIYIENSNYGTVEQNKIYNTGIGMEMAGGIGSKVYGNYYRKGSIGLYMLNSQTNLVKDNYFSNASTYGISCLSGSSNSSSQNLDLGGNYCSSNNDCRWMTSSPQCAVS